MQSAGEEAAADEGPKRQNERRKKSEPTKLSDTQYKIYAHRYAAARRKRRPVDYAQMLDGNDFKSFKGDVDELEALEGEVVAKLKEAWDEERAEHADAQAQAQVDLEAELEKSNLHCDEYKKKLEDQADKARAEELEQELSNLQANADQLRQKLETAKTALG